MKDSFNFRKFFSLVGIAVIAVVFTFSFGPGSRGCEASSVTPPGSVATVNGKEIAVTDFRMAYRNMVDQYRSQGLSEQLARQLGFDKQVLDQLVNTELLAQAAEKHGISPPDEELARLIQQNPGFHKDGRFDLQTYRLTLQQVYRQTDVEFERKLRRQLAAQMMLDTVESTAIVSEDEVRSRFLKEGNKAQLTFARFAPTMFADKVAAPKPEEVAAFKEANQEQIKAHYEQNKFLYSQPEQVRARHILIKTPENATDEQKQQARERVENLRKEIEGGKDFAAVATQFSEDVGSKEKGGDLGFNTADQWVKPFSDAAFSLKPGELSQPVESQFGYHLIKVEEKRPPSNRSLEEASDEIATQLWKKERAKVLAREAAAQALAQVKAGKALTALFPAPKAAEEQPMQFTQPTAPVAVESGEFNAATESVPRLGPAPSLLPDVFALKAPQVLDEVYEVGDAFVIAQVTARQEPTDEDYTAKKATLTDEARQAKQFELRDAFLKSLKASADVRTNDEVVGQVLGPAPQS